MLGLPRRRAPAHCSRARTAAPRGTFGGRRLAWCLLAALLAVGRAALGNPMAQFGFTSRATALGGAATAAARDLDAAFYNLAAATRVPGFTVGANLLLADDFLEANGRGAGLSPHLYVSAGLVAPLPIAPVLRDRLYATLVVGFPKEGFYRIELPDDEDVHFLFDGARNRRMVLLAGLAGRVCRQFSVGVGVSLLPAVTGRVDADLSQSAGQNRARLDVAYRVGALAGVLIEPLPWLAIGAAYRQAHDARLQLPLRATVYDGFALDARIAAPAYAVPHEVALGLEVRPLPALTVALDVTWSGYAGLAHPAPTVYVLEDGQARRASNVEPAGFRDTWAPRLGLEFRPSAHTALRAGYGYVPTPIPEQTGLSNLLDSDRHQVAVGLGQTFPGWSGGAAGMSLDVHMQVTTLQPRNTEKTVFDVENPGFPALRLRGGTLAAGLTWKVWF